MTAAHPNRTSTGLAGVAGWPDTTGEPPPCGDRYRSATWLLGRHPRLARLACRVTGVINTSELGAEGGDGEVGGPVLDLDHLAHVLNAATGYTEAWGEYANQYRPPQDESAYEQWRQAGPNSGDYDAGLGDFLVMSSGESAALRLLGVFASERVPLRVADLASLDAEGQRLLTDWTTALRAT